MRSLPRGVLGAGAFVNIALILAGILFAPATLDSLTGVGIVVADIGLQLAVAAAGLFGPVSLERSGEAAAYCLGMGVAFAMAYDGLLLLDFVGHPVALSPYVLFVTAAVVVSAAVGYRSRRVTEGMLAATWSLVLGTVLWSAGFLIIAYSFWGTRDAHLFWLHDGAVAEFRRSGGKDVSMFLLQDVQGALFFHPVLSLILGLLCGAAGGAVGRLGAALRRCPAARTS